MVGYRENGSFQCSEYRNVDLPCGFLDNDFEDPDLDRFLERYEEVDPVVAVIGDAYTVEEAQRLNETGLELLDESEYKESVAVPKCEEAFDVFSDELTLGFPIGYSDITAEDLGYHHWRGRRVHILGGSPVKQYDTIQKLEQPNLRGDPPADVVGVDGNGVFKAAFYGEYWSRSDWQEDEAASVRETLRKSFKEIKAFWEEKGLWPETEPCELYDEVVQEPDDPVYALGDDIRSEEQLHKAIVETYEDGSTRAYRSKTEKKFLEYREGLSPV